MVKPRVVPRRLKFDFSSVPRHWYYGSAAVTHAGNGLHLLFPEGERFFIRSVRRYLRDIDDPELMSRVQGFFAQEALHGCAHEEVAHMLEAQGFEVKEFLAWYRWLAYDVLEANAPKSWCLSVTVALEHLTATLAETAFLDGHLDNADPQMRELLLWHSAEEIEHKSVAFDVYETVDGRYWLRIFGMAVALTGLLGFSGVARRSLIRQDGVGRRQLRKERREARKRGQGRQYILDGLRSYLRRDFHPDQVDNYHLARDWAESRGYA